ncbi:SGNH/GDSL hydrolase family protein [Candidatus Curtissbacteria bacterium]|nr:SGNH/GDSL hydrolase family protein [Candidatus Curtissbacteria bacterium]
MVATSILATILFFCMSFTLSEAYFRFIYDKSDGLGFLKVNRKWHERHVRVNGDFKRDEEFKLQKNDKITRICAIGDSVTFGYGIENIKDRYTEILEKSLQENGYKVEVYNLAVSGANTSQEIETYRSFKFLSCDIILHQYTLNDIRTNEDQAKLLQENSRVSSLTKKVLDFSYFSDFIYWRLNQRYEDTFAKLQVIDFKDYENREKLNSHLSGISDYVQQVKSDGKKIIVVIFPMFYGPFDSNYPGWIHTVIGDQFAKDGTVVVDLLPIAVGKNVSDLRASPFDAHPNEYFHNLAAQRVYEPLKGLIDTN